MVLRTAPTWLKILLLGQLVSAAGALAWLYLTLYLVDARQVSPAAAGLVTATFGLGTILGNLVGGSVGDRFGLKPTLLASLAGWIVTCSAFPLTETQLLAPLALLAGATSGAGRPLMGALVASGMPAERRREAIALSRAASNAGIVIGPPLGALLAAHHFGLIFGFDAATSLVLLLAVARKCPSTARVVIHEGPRTVFMALRSERQMVLLLASVLAVDTTYRLLYTVLPLLIVAHHAPVLFYGLTLSLNCIVIVVFEPRIARRLAGHRAIAVIAAGYVFVGTGWLILGAIPLIIGAFLAVLVITAGEMLYKPTATAMAADLAPEGMIGRYQSLYAAASIGGMLLSPLLGIALYDAAPRLIWPIAGLVALGAAAALRQAPQSAHPSRQSRLAKR